MVSKIKSFFRLLRERKYKTIFNKFLIPIRKSAYLLRARIEDWRLGGISIGSTIPSKFSEIGCFASQSTDYRLLDRIFKSYPLKESDILMDVGCGEGRVLTYLYLRGIKNRLIGVEIDPLIAETAKKRTMNCHNIEIICSNVIDQPEVLSEVTAFYLFNPFGDAIIPKFLEMIEKHCKHTVTVYYVFDVLGKRHLDKRENWRILCRDVIYRPGMRPAPCSIYQYNPPKQ